MRRSRPSDHQALAAISNGRIEPRPSRSGTGPGARNFQTEISRQRCPTERSSRRSPASALGKVALEARRTARFSPKRGRFTVLLQILTLIGAVEKTRTSTGFRPQRPQRCASTNSATTAKSSGCRLRPGWGRSAPLAKGIGGCKRRVASPRNKRQPGFQPISALPPELPSATGAECARSAQVTYTPRVPCVVVSSVPTPGCSGKSACCRSVLPCAM